MFDGRGGGGALGWVLSGDWGRRSQVDNQSKQACANREVLSGLRQETGQRHEFPPQACTATCKGQLAECERHECEFHMKRNPQMQRLAAEQYAQSSEQNLQRFEQTLTAG
jgi:hypothetical protein